VANPYEVSIRIVGINSFGAMFAQLTAALAGSHEGVAKLQKGLEALKPAAFAAAGAIAGIAGLKGLNVLAEHGERLVHVKQQLLAADVKGLELVEATAKAWEISGKFGLDVVHVLADIKEARMVFGSTEHAINFIEPLEKMRVVLNSVTEGSGDKLKDAVYQMARAGELKGLQTPEQYVSYFDQMTKAITASGGKVDPKAFFQATQYGRLASVGFNEEFYTRYFPSIIQEMRPSGAGTALMSMFNQGVMGHISKRGTEAWEAAGLIADPSKLIRGPAGKLLGGWQYGAVKDSAMLTQNPF